MRYVLALALCVLAVPVYSHGDLSWPAKYRNASGTPCCEMTAPHGDCVRVGMDVAGPLIPGSVVTLDFPVGRRTTVINRIYPTEDGGAVICATGCAFKGAMS